MSSTEYTQPQPDAKYDLTSTIASYLDLHMMLPLIDFVEEKNIYNAEDVSHVRIQLLEPTYMFDFAMELMQQLDGSVDESLQEKRDVVISNMDELKNICDPILELLQDTEKTQELYDENLFNFEYLEANYSITAEVLDAFYQYSKCEYESGNYTDAAFYLAYYRLLDPDSDRSFAALWGKLAADILMKMWEPALEDVKLLQQLIDAKEEKSSLRVPNHLEQLQLRSWLLHWSLFVFFNHENGRNEIAEFFFQPKYLNAIQTNCPWLLRYLATAVITNKRKRNMVKQLVAVIQQEKYTYSDPITEFLEALYVDFDFDSAQDKLVECEKVLVTDFFLMQCHKEFMDNARLFIFETYCRVHTKIDLTMLSERLRLGPEESERWIVDLIRHAKLGAKIDSEKNQVVMGQQHPEIYQQIIDKTKDLAFRTFQIGSSVLALNEQVAQASK